MQLIAIIMFSLAISIDGLVFGFGYGIRRVTVSLLSLVLIGFTSGLSTAFAMVCGKYIGYVIAPSIEIKAGALLIIGIGIISLWKTNTAGQSKRAGDTFTFNNRGVLSWYEGLVLGVIMSLDAMAAGIGAAAVGFDIWKTCLLAGIAQAGLLKAGLMLGMAAKEINILRRLLKDFMSV